LRSTASLARTYGGQGGQKSQKFEPAVDKAGRRESSAVRVIDWFMFRNFMGAELCARFDSIPAAAMAGHQRALQLFEYVRQMFWPVDLIPFYVHLENRLEIWRLLIAAISLIALTAIVIVRRKQNPYLLVGWLWYIVMLIPVIGIVQVGLQGHADRYTYLPQIGLDIALVCLIWDLTKSCLPRWSASAKAGRLQKIIL